MTPFDVSQRLRALASQCENCDPTDTAKLQSLSGEIFDVAAEVRPTIPGDFYGEPESAGGQAERVG